MNFALYGNVSNEISALITRRYSTSFSLAVRLLEKKQRKAIWSVYGFVRLADEVVDTFHGYDKAFLLEKLREDLNYALEQGISTNPVLYAFARTVNEYHIDHSHISAFLDSMAADITKQQYASQQEMNTYIYGSADVVGLMCLRIFCNGDNEGYEKLKAPAAKLGSAFQKVNFLRDIRNDVGKLNRSYFPELQNNNLSEEVKKNIESNIKEDFQAACNGIKALPGRSKFAVLLAYTYYSLLFKKIQRSSAQKLMSQRIRIPNSMKYVLIVRVFIKYKLNRIHCG